eukprot:4821715-Karenia_brevis.AAC.1
MARALLSICYSVLSSWSVPNLAEAPDCFHAKLEIDRMMKDVVSFVLRACWYRPCKPMMCPRHMKKSKLIC